MLIRMADVDKCEVEVNIGLDNYGLSIQIRVLVELALSVRLLVKRNYQVLSRRRARIRLLVAGLDTNWQNHWFLLCVRIFE